MCDNEMYVIKNINKIKKTFDMKTERLLDN